MKNTKIMILTIVSFIITYLSVGFIGWVLSCDATYVECLRSIPLIIIMFTFGWIPAIVVSNDLDKHLK